MRPRSDAEKVEYLGGGSRLDVALQCLETGKTRDQIAAELDRAPGGLSAPSTLLNEGALVRAGTRNGKGGGELLRVAPGWRDAVREARDVRRAGDISFGCGLLLIPKTQVHRAAWVLTQATTRPDVAWAVDIHGDQMGLLIAARLDRTGAPTIRLMAALTDAGVVPAEFRVGEVRSGTALDWWLQAVGGTDVAEIEPV